MPIDCDAHQLHPSMVPSRVLVLQYDGEKYKQQEVQCGKILMGCAG